jgi:hypothetical protein
LMQETSIKRATYVLPSHANVIEEMPMLLAIFY